VSDTNVGNAVYKVTADASGVMKGLTAAESQIKSTGVAAERAFGQQATAGATKFGGALGGLQTRLGSSALSKGVLQGVGMGAALVAFQAVSAVVSDVVGGLEDSAKAAERYNAEMRLLQTQTGASAAEVDTMKSALLGLAGEVGQTPDELAKGLYHIESAGIRGAQALDILKVAAEGAVVGQTDLESVTNALLAAVNSGVGGVTDMTQAMGVMNAIVGAGNMRMADLTGALSTGILSVAKTFGVSIESVGAALADMTHQGIPAEEAATRLRMTLSLLGAPTTKAAGALKSIGLSTTDLAAAMRGPDGILGAVTLLRQHLDNSGLSATQTAALLSHAFGGGRTSSGIMTLVGNVDLLGQTQDRVNAGVDSFGPAWDAASQEVAVKIAKTNAFLDALRVKIGEGLTSATGDAITGIGELGTAFDNLHKAMDPAYFASQQLDAAIRDEAKALGVDGDAIVEWMHHKDDASSATKALATDQAKLNDLLAHMPSVAESLGNPLAAIAWTNAVAALTDKIAAEKEATTAGAAAVIAYTTSQHTAAAADYYREKSQVDLNDRIQKMMGLLGISTKAIVDNAAVEAEAGAAYAVAASHMGDAANVVRAANKAVIASFATMAGASGIKASLKAMISETKSAMDQVHWAIKNPNAWLETRTTLEKDLAKAEAGMARAVKTGNPEIIGAYQFLIDGINTKLATLPPHAKSIGDAWIHSLAFAIQQGHMAIEDALAIATGGMVGRSPPRVGPLRNIAVWGRNIGNAFIEPLLRRLDEARNEVNARLGGMGMALGMGGTLALATSSQQTVRHEHGGTVRVELSAATIGNARAQGASWSDIGSMAALVADAAATAHLRTLTPRRYA